MWWFLNNPTKNNPLISWALSLNVWMMRLLRVIENFQNLVENVAENLQHITQGRETPSGQSPANVVAPLCCCCWFCAVLCTLRATIASALAGRRSPLHRTTTTTAAAHGRPPADTQTKTEKRGTKSSAPSSQLYMTETLQSTTRVWTEERNWYILIFIVSKSYV